MRNCLLIMAVILFFSGVLSSIAATQSTGVSYAQGQVVGPIDDGAGSSYFLYVPKTLPTDRKVPLLFYTHSGGGNAGLLTEISEGAELTGWIMAVSVQSKNELIVEDCVKYSKNSIEHILKTLPVDENRIYFTGNSGGGAQAFRNATRINACGVMPNVGYIPSDCSAPSCDCFIMNGGYDYNRKDALEIRSRILT